MSLKEILQCIVADTDGALAAMVMAHDGIAIDEVIVGQAGFDVQLLSAGYTTVLRDIREAAGRVGAGALEELTLVTARYRVVIRILNDELCAVLVMAPAGNTGKGRYLLRLSGDDILRELR
jgi:predicted regulator of Ras-like GTPase activity (Roadblock/LC7/MglB family)